MTKIQIGCDKDKSLRPHFSESCRLVQGSKVTGAGIPLEPRTEARIGCVGRAGPARYSGNQVLLNKQNKSGTAEVYFAFVS